MSEDNTKKVTRTREHPLEEEFDIERGSTEVAQYEYQGEYISGDGYDEKDSEVEGQYQEVYDKAMSGYAELSEEVEDVEGKYKARLAEVSLQYLNTALNAAERKGKMKEHKDKLKQQPSGGSGNSNGGGGKTTLEVDLGSFIEQLRDNGKDEQ